MEKVSVTVVTYNANWKKLRTTLLSILYQKKIEFEIVLADDGSRENYKDKIIALFKEYEFNNYKLVMNAHNQGTVKNIYSALQVAEGKYIRSISPGDYLYDENSLAEWVDFMERGDYKASFGKAVYYNDDSKLKIFNDFCSPKNFFLYRKEQWNVIHREYLLIDDQILGAAFLTDRELLTAYVKELLGRVRLGEDYAYSIMVYDHINLYLFDKPVVWYEYGHGVSTVGAENGLSPALRKDYHSMQRIILEHKAQTGFDRKFKNFIRMNLKLGNGYLWKIYKSVRYPEIYCYYAWWKTRKEQEIKDIDYTFWDRIQ